MPHRTFVKFRADDPASCAAARWPDGGDRSPTIGVDPFGLGAVQLPDILIEIDARTHFSWILLGRQPASTFELTLVYWALLGLGTMQSAAGVSQMVAGVSDDRIEHVMRQIIANGQLRPASDAVANHMLSHPVARRWGTGNQASADMMSLDATRHLWNARTEPRRGTKAIGTYQPNSTRAKHATRWHAPSHSTDLVASVIAAMETSKHAPLHST